MTKFSVGGDDVGEGASSGNTISKRPRFHFTRYPEARHPNVQVFYSSEEEVDEEHPNHLDDDGRDLDCYPFSPAELNPNTPISTDALLPQRPEESAQEGSASVVFTSTETESQAQAQAQSEPQPPVMSNENGDGSVCRVLGIEMSGSISVTLTDTDALDCPVCCEPFTVPVFQCENGHTACSSCCRKLAQRCPSCTLPIGYSRCRAIEKVIESVTISCHNLIFGCKEMIAYGKKHDHEKTCIYAPCLCPHLGCSFINSSNQLYQHSTIRHAGSTIRFRFNSSFPVSFTFRDKFLVLQEEKKGVLFIIHNKSEPYGNAFTMSCIGPSSPATYSYALTATKKKSILRFQSVMTHTQSRVEEPASVGFLLVPGEFFCANGGLSMDVQIWRSIT